MSRLPSLGAPPRSRAHAGLARLRASRRWRCCPRAAAESGDSCSPGRHLADAGAARASRYPAPGRSWRRSSSPGHRRGRSLSRKHLVRLPRAPQPPGQRARAIVRVARLFSVTDDSLLRDIIPIEALAAHMLPPSTSELSTQYFDSQLRVFHLQRNLSQVELARQLMRR
jgi:hypothetical protein